MKINANKRYRSLLLEHEGSKYQFLLPYARVEHALIMSGEKQGMTAQEIAVVRRECVKGLLHSCKPENLTQEQLDDMADNITLVDCTRIVNWFSESMPDEKKNLNLGRIVTAMRRTIYNAWSRISVVR